VRVLLFAEDLLETAPAEEYFSFETTLDVVLF
jgi:hypothetical protein